MTRPTTVAILGRPNVGKSTLFNRLVGSRRALVHDMPGVTRDRLEGEAHYGDLTYRVIDTAGMTQGAEGSLAGRLTALSLAGLDEADVGLFLIDAREGVTTLDQELAERLRRSSKPLLLVANKCEGRAAIAGAADAWSLGLGEPIAVSAEHGQGLAELLDALLPHLVGPMPTGTEAPGPIADAEAVPTDPADAAQPIEAEDEAGFLRLAVVGRPNVGKSSLVNRLIQSDRLLTGPEPGLTRDAVSIAWAWEGQRIELVDTAGLRRKAKVDAGVERLSASSSVRAIRGAHIVLLVVDAQQPLEQQDLAIARLAIDEGRALVLAVNKWDLVETPQATLRELRLVADEKLTEVRGVELVAISAKTGRNLERLLPAVTAAHARWRRRVSTGQLNRWLKEALDKHPPPLVQGRRLKIRYATQTTNRPPTFALFANKPGSALPGSYLRYLSTSLRDSFDLGGVPLRFHVRHADNPYDKP